MTERSPDVRRNHAVMRRPVRGVSRVFASLLVALQALLWIGGPILDGAHEASSARTQPHVEELGGTKCPKVHSALDCLICRTLGEGVLTSHAESLDFTCVRAGVAFYETANVHSFGAHWGALGSRAPPRA